MFPPVFPRPRWRTKPLLRGRRGHPSEVRGSKGGAAGLGFAWFGFPSSIIYLVEGKTWDKALCPRSFVRLVACKGSCGCARAAVPGGDGFPGLSRRWMPSRHRWSLATGTRRYGGSACGRKSGVWARSPLTDLELLSPPSCSPVSSWVGFGGARSPALGGEFSLGIRAFSGRYLLPTSKGRNGLETTVPAPSPPAPKLPEEFTHVQKCK